MQLSKVEDQIIELEEDAVDDVTQKGELCLIRKVQMDRSIGSSLIEGVMAKVWRLSRKARFKAVGSNIFIMSFATYVDKMRVEHGRPWLFDNHILVIEAFDGLIQSKNTKFDRASLCLQLLQLPYVGMNKKCGEQIDKTIGKVGEVDVDEEDVGWGQSLRIKVRIDLTKPVARGRTITIKGTKYWIPVKYEKMPRVYFKCGCIVYDQK